MAGSQWGFGKNWKGKLKSSRPISRVLSWTIIHLGYVSPHTSCSLPESSASNTLWIPIWPCSKRGLPCHGMLPPMRCALTAPFHPYLSTLQQSGGFFSVALSVGSRPPGVTWHFALWSPDFPPPPF